MQKATAKDVCFFSRTQIGNRTLRFSSLFFLFWLKNEEREVESCDQAALAVVVSLERESLRETEERSLTLAFTVTAVVKGAAVGKTE